MQRLLQQFIHVPVIVYLARLFQHAHVFGILQKLGSENEFIQPLIFAENDLFVAAFPGFLSLVHVNDMITDLHHTVHVMCIHDGGDIEFRGTSGSMKRTQPDCCADIHGVAGSPSGPFAAWHGVSGKHACVGNLACCSHHAVFPGGGGGPHVTASTDACWGSFGAGGLVRVTYS